MKRHAEKPTKMARGAARLAAALLALAAAGCGNAASSQPPPRDALSRRWRAPLFMGATPERPHRDIGLVQAFGAGAISMSVVQTPTEMVTGMRSPSKSNGSAETRRRRSSPTFIA